MSVHAHDPGQFVIGEGWHPTEPVHWPAPDSADQAEPRVVHLHLHLAINVPERPDAAR